MHHHHERPRSETADSVEPVPLSSSVAIDATILRLLALNDGAISRQRLAEAGIRRAAIARRISSGALIELAPGVVGLPTPPDRRRQHVRAGSLSPR